ncbi:MAG: phosphoribosylformylglycinamidine cyclo-ligase [Acidobacteria bacterium]|nr:phosphoribosylformylglycinamidine cyclo-ligase [Acidobacteriota bacterium]
MSNSRYEQAGVSIKAQDEAIHRLKGHVARTENKRVISSVGSFGGLFDISFPNLSQPVLVSSTDGVGTKIKIAIDAGIHDTIGQCLVNHCIDDILVQGARPLFFMDYISTGKLAPAVVEQVLKGMADACCASECAILGGELAEMPGFYKTGDYDVAGFIVGVVDRPKILGAHRVKVGQKLIGLKSSGLHTNGYSLARKIIFEEQGLGLQDEIPGTGKTAAQALLAVHRNYHPLLWPLLEANQIAAMAHITGGGFLDNIPRVLPPDCCASIDLKAVPKDPLFAYLVEKGGMDANEPYQVFNMGIGMILMVDHDQVQAVQKALEKVGEPSWVIGDIVSGNGKVNLLR